MDGGREVAGTTESKEREKGGREREKGSEHDNNNNNKNARWVGWRFVKARVDRKCIFRFTSGSLLAKLRRDELSSCCVASCSAGTSIINSASVCIHDVYLQRKHSKRGGIRSTV